MSTSWILVVVVVALAVVAAYLAYNGRSTGDARALIDQGALVIDVRTPEEFASGHLPEAKNIPLQDLPGRLPEIERSLNGKKDQPIVVYCRSGARSSQARTLLNRAGFSAVTNGGGFSSLAR